MAGAAAKGGAAVSPSWLLRRRGLRHNDADCHPRGFFAKLPDGRAGQMRLERSGISIDFIDCNFVWSSFDTMTSKVRVPLSLRRLRALQFSSPIDEEERCRLLAVVQL